MKKVDHVVDKDGKRIELVGEMDCRTVGAIYAMWCGKCEKVVYVGKTMNSHGLVQWALRGFERKGQEQTGVAFQRGSYEGCGAGTGRRG